MDQELEPPGHVGSAVTDVTVYLSSDYDSSNDATPSSNQEETFEDQEDDETGRVLERMKVHVATSRVVTSSVANSSVATNKSGGQGGRVF